MRLALYLFLLSLIALFTGCNYDDGRDAADGITYTRPAPTYYGGHSYYSGYSYNPYELGTPEYSAWEHQQQQQRDLERRMDDLERQQERRIDDLEQRQRQAEYDRVLNSTMRSYTPNYRRGRYGP